MPKRSENKTGVHGQSTCADTSESLNRQCLECERDCKQPVNVHIIYCPLHRRKGGDKACPTTG